MSELKDVIESLNRLTKSLSREEGEPYVFGSVEEWIAFEMVVSQLRRNLDLDLDEDGILLSSKTRTEDFEWKSEQETVNTLVGLTISAKEAVELVDKTRDSKVQYFRIPNTIEDELYYSYFKLEKISYSDLSVEDRRAGEKVNMERWRISPTGYRFDKTGVRNELRRATASVQTLGGIMENTST